MRSGVSDEQGRRPRSGQGREGESDSLALLYGQAGGRGGVGGRTTSALGGAAGLHDGGDVQGGRAAGGEALAGVGLEKIKAGERRGENERHAPAPGLAI